MHRHVSVGTCYSPYTHTHVHIRRHICILAYGRPRALSAVLLSMVPVTPGQLRLEADSPPDVSPAGQ